MADTRNLALLVPTWLKHNLHGWSRYEGGGEGVKDKQKEIYAIKLENSVRYNGMPSKIKFCLKIISAEVF